MPDPNTEHGLRVQLATAVRERDEFRKSNGEWLARATAAESERDALRADVKRLRDVLTEIADHGGMNRGIWSQSQARAALATGGDCG